jgi:hypothetical protein
MRRSWLLGAVAVVLAAGAGIGYLVSRPASTGHAAASTTPAAASTMPAAASTTPAADETTSIAAQTPITAPPRSALVDLPGPLDMLRPSCLTVLATAGRPLTVGVKLFNNGPSPLTLGSVRGVFPRGGLRQLDTRLGHCDLHATGQVPGDVIPPHGTARVSMNLDVLVRCPESLSVQFRVDYSVDGAPTSQLLRPFPDLRDADYPGC